MTSNGPPNARPLRTGDPHELGQYRILGRLGRGGMGTVYLAQDSQGRNVAVKLIHPDLSDDEDFRRRFAREVQAARSVARFSTAAVLDAQLDGETLYIVSEYVAGPNLAEAIRDEGPMFSGTLEGLAVGVAAALTAIHGAGVIHRDLKPANVLLSSVGPKVIDFGIARALDDENAVTRSSQLMGTPAYLAPELILGQGITPASDIFSWGCLVAFAGTGNAPFDAPTVPAVLHQISTAEPNLEGFDETLRAVVGQALAKEPGQRPSAQQILDTLVGKNSADAEEVGHTVLRSWTPPAAGAAPQAPPSQPGDTGPRTAPTADLDHRRTAAMHASPYQGQGPPTPPPPGGAPGSGPQQPYGPGGPPPPGYYGMPSGPQQPHPGPPAGSGRSRMWLLGGAAALALVLLAVVAVIVLRDPAPPEGVVIYSDDFSSDDSGWGRFGREFEPGEDGNDHGYFEGESFAVRADDRNERNGFSSPFEDEELPSSLMVETSAEIGTSPDQGQFGVYCFRDGDEETAYEFLVRADGAQAQIRKLAGDAGESAFATSDSVPGFDTSEGATNTIVATCEAGEDDSVMRLRMWINDRLALEETDTNPVDRGPMNGLVARLHGGGSGPDTVVHFHHFTLYELPEG